MKDFMVKSHSTATYKAITTHAECSGYIVHITHADGFYNYKLISLSKEGIKCELVANELQLRAARHCLNQMAYELKWDDKENGDE